MRKCLLLISLVIVPYSFVSYSFISCSSRPVVDLALADTAVKAAQKAKADKLDDVIDAGVLRCGVVLDFPPIGYRDANNEPAGFDVEYCNDMAAALEVDAVPAGSGRGGIVPPRPGSAEDL